MSPTLLAWKSVSMPARSGRIIWADRWKMSQSYESGLQWSCRPTIVCRPTWILYHLTDTGHCPRDQPLLLCKNLYNLLHSRAVSWLNPSEYNWHTITNPGWVPANLETKYAMNISFKLWTFVSFCQIVKEQGLSKRILFVHQFWNIRISHKAHEPLVV